MTTIPSGPHEKKSILRQYIRPSLFLLGSLFFVLLVIRSWEETKEVIGTIEWCSFAGSLVLGLLDLIIISLVFQQLLKKFCIILPYEKIGRMFFYGQMAKYIPGRLWSVLYQRSFIDIPGATVILFFANIELLVVCLIRNFFIGISLVIAGIQMLWALAVYLGGGYAFAAVSRTDLIVSSLGWIGAKIKRRSSSQIRISDKPEYHILIYYYILATLTFLSSNFLMMYAVFGYFPNESYLYIAFLSVAWVIGVLTIIVPAGMGVREVVFVGIAQWSGSDLSLELLTAMAVVYRFWLIALEIGGISFAMIISRFSEKDK